MNEKRKTRGPTIRKFQPSGKYLDYFDTRKEAKSYMIALAQYYRDNPQVSMAELLRKEREKGIIIPKKVWFGELKQQGIETRQSGWHLKDVELTKKHITVRLQKRVHDRLGSYSNRAKVFNSLGMMYCGIPLENEGFIWIESLKMFLHIYWKDNQYMCHFSDTPSKELIEVIQGLLNQAQNTGLDVIKKFARSTGWSYFG